MSGPGVEVSSQGSSLLQVIRPPEMRKLKGGRECGGEVCSRLRWCVRYVMDSCVRDCPGKSRILTASRVVCQCST